MDVHKEALAVLPSIYDSAIQSSNWGETLEESAHRLSAKGALLLIIDQHPEGAFQVSHFSNIWSRAPKNAAIYNQQFGHYEKPVWDELYRLSLIHI